MAKAEGARLRFRDARAFVSSLTRTQQSMEALAEQSREFAQGFADRIDGIRAEEDTAPAIRAGDWMRVRIAQRGGIVQYLPEQAPFPEAPTYTCIDCQLGEDGRRRRDEAAEELLREHLTDKQRELRARGLAIEVVSRGGRRYKINDANVHACDGPLAGTDFCIQLDSAYPAGDAVLARKLLLETDELRFLATAVGGNTCGRSAIIEDLAAKGMAPHGDAVIADARRNVLF